MFDSDLKIDQDNTEFGPDDVAVLFDKRSKKLLKYGEPAQVQEYQHVLQMTIGFTCGTMDQVNDLVMVKCKRNDLNVMLAKHEADKRAKEHKKASKGFFGMLGALG